MMPTIGSTPELTYEITGQGEYEIDSLQQSFDFARLTEFDKYYIANFGSANNYSIELRNAIQKNHIIPQLIEKKVGLLYGEGPYLYKNEIVDGQMQRMPVVDTEIVKWLKSWTGFGIDSYEFYLLDCIREFYYTEGVFTQYVFNKSRRWRKSGGVLGLKYLPSKDVRVACVKNGRSIYQIFDADIDNYIYGKWEYVGYAKEFEVLPKFSHSEPYKHPNPVNYARNKTFATDFYAYNSWYEGLKNWIMGSNETADYINSFLKNSLSAKYHVIIPYKWVEQQRNTLVQLCINNRELKETNKPTIESYEGVVLGIQYKESMINELVNNSLKKIQNLLTGKDNQGKFFASYSFLTELGLDNWKIEEIPMKYKEFVESIISYDRRAVETILEGIGMDAAISNVSKEGVISKSGSDALYNYKIYKDSLTIAEMICTYDINNAIQINFTGKEDIKLGFYQSQIQREESVSSKDRFINN